MTNAERSTKSTADATNNGASALWRIVVSEYETTLADFRLVDKRHTEASHAYSDEMGEPDPKFAMYGLLFGPRYSLKAREDKIFHTAMLIAAAEYVGKELSRDDYQTIMAEAARLVDESNARKLKDREVGNRIMDKPQADFDAACDRLSIAREKVFDTPSPDAAAFLSKVELLSDYLTEVDSEDAERVRAIRDDARRLFGDK